MAGSQVMERRALFLLLFLLLLLCGIVAVAILVGMKSLLNLTQRGN